MAASIDRNKEKLAWNQDNLIPGCTDADCSNREQVESNLTLYVVLAERTMAIDHTIAGYTESKPICNARRTDHKKADDQIQAPINFLTINIKGKIKEE